MEIKRNNKQVLFVFLVLLIIELLIGHALTLDLIGGVRFSGRITDAYGYWQSITIQFVVILFFYVKFYFRDGSK